MKWKGDTTNKVAECVFADDIVILAKIIKDLQHNMNVWREELKRHGMTISQYKTKVMVIAKIEKETNIEQT